MLKLMVEKDDRVLIGDDIMLTVLHTGGRPQLAIDAPKSVKLTHVKSDIDRMFLNRKRKEQHEA
jgi:sRNA-binding carbon storage regulator CsrA